MRYLNELDDARLITGPRGDRIRGVVAGVRARAVEQATGRCMAMPGMQRLLLGIERLESALAGRTAWHACCR